MRAPPKALPTDEFLRLLAEEPAAMPRRMLAGEAFVLFTKADAELQVRAQLVHGEPRAVVSAWRRVGEGWELFHEGPPITLAELLEQVRAVVPGARLTLH